MYSVSVRLYSVSVGLYSVSVRIYSAKWGGRFGLAQWEIAARWGQVMDHALPSWCHVMHVTRRWKARALKGERWRGVRRAMEGGILFADITLCMFL